MSGYAIKRIDEMEARHEGLLKLAGAELGVEAFGIQVLDLPGGFGDYPAHDHSADGQEELYVVMRGTAEFEIDGERVSAGAGGMVRVDPTSQRKLVPGPDGARILAIGCARGAAYERPDDFRLAVRA
jgi:mannose-6-phosphate isomerase-like protein (cupin superfamily)